MLRLPLRSVNYLSDCCRFLHHATRPGIKGINFQLLELPPIVSNIPFPFPPTQSIIQDLSINLSLLPRNLGELSISDQFPGAKKIIQEVPLVNITIENPKNTLINEIREKIKHNPIESPTSPNPVNEILAVHLIVIRKRKMKKHKLKKLRKKMKFEWAKVRQRREMRKEKAFQAGLIAQIKQAEKFSAEEYVMSKLKQANEVPIPRYWKGRRLPQFIIKEKLGIK